MTEKMFTILEALEKLHRLVTEYTPQSPNNHREDYSKVEYLYRAVLGNEWPHHDQFQAIAANPPDFTKMFTNLDSVWLQH